MSDLITATLVRLDAALGDTKQDVIRSLAAVVGEAGRSDDVDQLVVDAFAREETSATGLPGGMAIPHCRTAGVEEPTLAFARLAPGVDFGAKDGPADLVFLIAAPAGGDADHLQILTQLARALVKPAFTDSLRSAASAEDVVELVRQELGQTTAPTPAAPSAAPAAAAPPSPEAASASSPEKGGPRSLVAVTACPTGIAHTYMAAEALEAAAEKAGVSLQVETQGSAGSTPLSPDTIANAAAVIFAVDVGVRDRGRFAGKPVVSSGVKRPIAEADAMIAEALRYADDPNAPRVEGTAGASGGDSTSGQETWGGRTRRVRPPHVSSAPAPPSPAVALPSTRGASGSPAYRSASAIIASASSIGRFTPEETIGLPPKRERSRTPTSTAKITAPAAAMVSGASGVEPADPCVSTWIWTPARSAAASRASAAM